MTEEIVQRPRRFRILIIGRANAGKTTILRALSGGEGEPSIYDQDGNNITPKVYHEEMLEDVIFAGNEAITQRSTRSVFSNALRTIRAHIMCGVPGSILAPDPSVASALSSRLRGTILSPSAFRGEHNVEYSLIFPSSPGFIFHDSRGFESGAVEELELIREFIQKKATLGSMQTQLHAILYCLPCDGIRFMTAVDKEFFNGIDTGNVPVIAVFTKFDALDSIAFSALSEQGVPFEEAQRQAPEHAQAQFDQGLLPLIGQLAHPPRAVVYLRNMHSKRSPDFKKGVSDLLEHTEAALDDHALKVLLVQAQHVSVERCMIAAVTSGVITKAAQSALIEDPAAFSPLQNELIQGLFKYFPSIWVGQTPGKEKYMID